MDVQATGEASSPLKRTSSSFRQYIFHFFLFMIILPIWICLADQNRRGSLRIRIHNTECIHIRIRRLRLPRILIESILYSITKEKKRGKFQWVTLTNTVCMKVLL
jgi:hypothetical protein